MLNFFCVASKAGKGGAILAELLNRPVKHTGALGIEAFNNHLIAKQRLLRCNISIGIADLAHDRLGLHNVCRVCLAQNTDRRHLQLRHVSKNAAHDRAISSVNDLVDDRAESILAESHHIARLTNQRRVGCQCAAHQALEPIRVHARNLGRVNDSPGALCNVRDCGSNHCLLRRDAINFTNAIAKELDVQARILCHEAPSQANALVPICNEQPPVCVFVDGHNAGDSRIPFRYME